MTFGDLIDQDEEVAKSAVRALTIACDLARLSGRTMVFVENGVIVQTGPAGKKILSRLPIRRKVTSRIKKATP